MKLIIASEEQKRARDPLTWEAWGQRLGVEAFCQREIRLRAHPWCREAMQTWLLVDDAGALLASCETFRMRSFAGGVEGHTPGIASVYTEPALRGRGYASAMMRLLGERMRADGAQAALLFSEVGATLYGNVGYVPRFLFDRLVPAAQTSVEVKWIGERDLAAALASFPLPDDRFLVWPTAAQLDWHLERERIYAGLLGRERPSTVGAVVGAGRILWAADFKNERLAVLLAHAPDEATAVALVRAACSAAASAGLREVRIWEEPSLPLPAGLGTRVRRDDDALPMLVSFTPGIGAEDWRSIPRALWI